MNVNKVIIVGNITKDPEMKALPSGQKVTSFSVATNEVFKDASGQKQERVEFHNIVAWGKTAENIAQYMRKGSQIYVEGKLQTRSWEADGIKKYRTEIVALNVQFGAKPQGGGGSSKPSTSEDDGWGAFSENENGGGSTPSDDDINPDDIPF